MNIRTRTILFSLFFCYAFFFARYSYATTNVSATTTDHWAWIDSVGWLDFFNTNTVSVSSTVIHGYASSSAGDISMNCDTTRNGNICTSSNYSVTNDGAGNLSSWAWNDEYGWISFDCNNNSGCGVSNYRVYIDGSGNFRNYAWNDAVGWISFNCLDSPLGCSASNYKVNTSWVASSTSGTLDSTTYDTGVNAGAQLNSVLWHGSQPAGTSVKFQFATSNASSGPWNFMGSDGTSNSYYPSVGLGAPDQSINLDYSLHSNFRYFRYRVILYSNTTQTLSPRIDEIIVNWSP